MHGTRHALPYNIIAAPLKNQLFGGETITDLFNGLPCEKWIGMHTDDQRTSLQTIMAAEQDLGRRLSAHSGNGNAVARFCDCIKTVRTYKLHAVFKVLTMHLISRVH